MKKLILTPLLFSLLSTCYLVYFFFPDSYHLYPFTSPNSNQLSQLYNCEYARLNCSCVGHGGCFVTCYLTYSHTLYNQTSCSSSDPSLFLKGFTSSQFFPKESKNYNPIQNSKYF